MEKAAFTTTSKILIIILRIVNSRNAKQAVAMGRTAKVSTRKANGAARPAGPDAAQELDLTALRQTPGFMIRILQLQNFEAFYPYFESLKLSPLEYAILITVRDNKTVTQSEL